MVSDLVHCADQPVRLGTGKRDTAAGSSRDTSRVGVLRPATGFAHRPDRQFICAGRVRVACFLEVCDCGAAWGTVFAATTLFFFGRLLAPAYAVCTAGIDFQHGQLLRAEGLLFSPSRGLLVFVPIVLFASLLDCSVLAGLVS